MSYSRDVKFLETSFRSKDSEQNSTELKVVRYSEESDGQSNVSRNHYPISDCEDEDELVEDDGIIHNILTEDFARPM